MVTVKNDLTVIKMYWEGNTYQIKAEGVKYTDKQSNEVTYATDSIEPNEITFGKSEYSIDLSGVQNYFYLFNWIRERQNKGLFSGYPHIACFHYVNGSLKTHTYWRHVFVEEISGEDQKPFDVKLVALGRNYRDSKNAFYR